MNARSRASGYTTSLNNAGRNLDLLLDRDIVVRIGPDFPTYVSPSSSTKPDIVLVNRAFYYNYHIKPGPITNSDHIPMLIEVSTNPIQISVPPRKVYRKANWEGYKSHLSGHVPADLSEATLEEIDKEIDKINDTIIEADERFTPKTKYKTIPHPKRTEDMKQVEEEFEELREEIELAGMNRDIYNRMNILKR